MIASSATARRSAGSQAVIDRREVLKRVAMMLGGAISVPVISAVLGGCQRGSSAFVPRALAPEQYEIVTTLCEMIIPQTDTPGASAARVNEFIDLLLADWFSEDERTRFMAGFAELDARCAGAFGRTFAEASTLQRTSVAAELDQESVALRLAGEKRLPFFGVLKELTLVGYYTSRIGSESELAQQTAFSHYDGCADLQGIGRVMDSPISK